MSNPWMKFYPRDWRGDQALRAVSIAARGLWIECLCIMHEAKPYGHLLVNGQKVEDDTLARMAGVSVDEVQTLMSELQQAGVFSLTRKGVVFSRRMTKDFSRSQKGRKSAYLRYSQDTEDKQETTRPNGSPSRVPTTQKPEARSQKEKDPPGFDDWYAAYPRKVGKGQARKAYAGACKKTDSETLLRAAEGFSRTIAGTDEKFIPHPATWLNGERWLDEVKPAEQVEPTNRFKRIAADYGQAAE